MKKRGQAAAFIIIGIILLVVVGAFIAVKTEFLDDLFSKIATERKTVPQQVKPLQDFLDSCVKRTAEQAVQILALQGGYIELQQDSIPTTSFTPLGSTLEIIPNSGFATSVWFRERGNGIQDLNVPSKEKMELEIENYLERNFIFCVANLTEFDERGYETTANGIPKADVIIADRKISTKITFPINVKIESTDFLLEEHTAEFSSNLGLLHKTAKEILEAENKGFFLENKTIDMLVAYDQEIPFSGIDLSCQEKIWFKDEVQEKLKNILQENTAAIRIKGTNYELQNDKYKYMEFNALKSSNKEITANLMYLPNWPTLIEITPSEGNILKSQQISKQGTGPVSAIVSAFFCLNHHRFVYDIKYPILITLRDENNLVFQFATQVIIDNNEPREYRKEILEIPDTRSPICDYPTKEVSIFTGFIDENNDLKPLNDVKLSFKCFPAACDLGSSILNPKVEPVLTTKVPACYNGIIEGSKEGYKQIQKTIYSSNNENTPPLALVQLEKIYKKPVKVFVIEKDSGKVREPYDSEQITFTFTHKEVTDQRSYLHPSETNEIELLPGKYLISAFILREATTYKFSVPAQELESCVDSKDFGIFALFSGKTQVCKKTKTKPLELETVLTGGFQDYEHNFKREELASEESLNLFVVSSGIPTSLEDLQRVSIEIETNKDHPEFKPPVIR